MMTMEVKTTRSKIVNQNDDDMKWMENDDLAIAIKLSM